MTHTQNPLLDFTDLPRFDLIQPEHVKPAIESLLADGRALIEKLTADSTPATWTDFAGAMSDGLEVTSVRRLRSRRPSGWPARCS